MPRLFGQLRRRPKLLLVLLFVGAVSIVAPAAVAALTSPSTAVESPVDGSTVTGDLVATGNASHNEGVESVEVCLLYTSPSPRDS